MIEGPRLSVAEVRMVGCRQPQPLEKQPVKQPGHSEDNLSATFDVGSYVLSRAPNGRIKYLRA